MTRRESSLAVPRSLSRRARWWTGAAILAAVLVALAWNFYLREVGYRQERVLTTAFIVLVGVLALALWVAFLAPFSWRVRGEIALCALVALGLLTTAIELRGVTGDLVPIIGWRFGSTTELASESGAPAVVEPSDAPAFHWRDWPQLLGEERVAAVPGVRLARDWRTDPPRELWRRPVGSGWSSFATAGERAITQEQRGEREAVTCYGTLDGELRWIHEIEARYATEVAGEGPRATPTVSGSRVYAVGATGVLVCLELETGERVWSVDVVRATGGSTPEWGYSSSPLVRDGRVILPPGNGTSRSLVAYDAQSGAHLWTGGDDDPSYSSPSQRLLAGVPQILVLNAHTLAALDPASGRELWDAPWDFPNPNVCQPLVLPGDRVFVSSGYGAGCALFHVELVANDVLAPTQEWKTRSLKSKFATYVHRDGFVYGLDDGILACLDLADGRRRWKDGRYGHGQLVLVDDLLLVTSEDGDLVLVEAVPDEHRELARLPALAGKTWNAPALAAPLLLVRNDTEAACYHLHVIDR